MFIVPPKEERRAAEGNSPPSEDPADSFKTYLEYNKVLRTWFVASGVGGPALFLVNEKIAEKLVKANLLREVAALFLIGAAAQILGALANKVSNWYVYWGGYNDRRVDAFVLVHDLAHGMANPRPGAARGRRRAWTRASQRPCGPA
jgi:hypothetical protein